jgi:hypothetical protein
VTELSLHSTGNPSQYEVMEGEQIVGRIALFSALRDHRKPWSGLLILRSVLAVSGCMASRRRAKPRWKPSLDPGCGTGEARALFLARGPRSRRAPGPSPVFRTF